MPDVLRLPQPVQAYVERRLDLLADFVINLVIIRSARFMRTGARLRDRFAVERAGARHDVRVQITLSLRALIGGRLRRQLKARGLKARAAAILRALQNLDGLVAYFVRRMREGLSRRMSAHSLAPVALCSACAEMLGAKSARLASTLAVELRAAAPP